MDIYEKCKLCGLPQLEKICPNCGMEVEEKNKVDCPKRPKDTLSSLPSALMDTKKDE